ncbi:MAG: hypothetical protein ACFFCH_02405 [Promethearchaeota archaeon]
MNSAKSSKTKQLRGPAVLAFGGLLSLGALAVTISMGISPLSPSIMGGLLGMFLFPMYLVLAPSGLFFLGLGLLYILRDVQETS